MGANHAVLGAFEFAIMATIASNSGQVHGGRIHKSVRSELNQDVSKGAVYATLKRLEKKKYITPKTYTQENGRQIKVFELSSFGSMAIQNTINHFYFFKKKLLSESSIIEQ